MERTNDNQKLESFNLHIPADLKAAFQAAALSDDRQASEVIRSLMELYVEERMVPDADHDSWFRAHVQQALDDDRADVPDDDVMRRTRAILDRVAGQKT